MKKKGKKDYFCANFWKMRKIEVCCISANDVLEARKGGAIRVELCTAISSGGVTPSIGLVRSAVKAADGGLLVNVLIRPREGGFCYDESEIRTMLEDIQACRSAGADGVVIGALTPDGDIDMEACRRMMDAASGMNVTFHRAFDVCREPEKALEQIIELGFDHLLTSGQRPSALEGSALIADLVRQAAGRITIMPGSGVNPGNIAEIESLTSASEFHSTARDLVPDSSLRHVPELGFDEVSKVPGMVLRTSSEVVRSLVD